MAFRSLSGGVTVSELQGPPCPSCSYLLGPEAQEVCLDLELGKHVEADARNQERSRRRLQNCQNPDGCWAGCAHGL